MTEIATEAMMFLEVLARTAVQSSILFLVIWGTFRCFRSFPANQKAWIWRLAFLKPIAGLLPFAAITLHILTPTPSAPAKMSGTSNQPIVNSSEVAIESLPVLQIDQTPNPIDPILILWGIGAAAVAGSAMFRRIKAARIVRNAEPLKGEAINTILLRLLQRANLTTKVQLMQSADIQSAMLFGGRRTVIVLPKSETDESEIRLALAHEVAHIARRDLAWLSLTFVVRSLFFFNPIVWLAVKNSQLDHESATDWYACELADVPVQTYAEMLLRATVVTRNPLVPGTLSVGESFRTIHRRLEAMKHFNSEPNRTRKAAMGIVALATIGLIPMYQFAQAKPGQSSDVKPPTVAPQGSRTTNANDPLKTSPSSDSPQSVKVSEHPKPIGPYRVSEVKVAEVAPKAAAAAQKTKTPTKTKKSKQVVARALDPFKPRSDVGPNVGSDPFVTKAADALPPKGMDVQQEVVPPSRTADDIVGNALPANGSGNPFGSGQRIETPTGNAKKITFKFEYCNVRQALIEFFKVTGQSYVIDDSVNGMIAVSGKDVNTELALALILKAGKADSYTEDGTIVITVKRN